MVVVLYKSAEVKLKFMKPTIMGAKQRFVDGLTMIYTWKYFLDTLREATVNLVSQ